MILSATANSSWKHPHVVIPSAAEGPACPIQYATAKCRPERTRFADNGIANASSAAGKACDDIPFSPGPRSCLDYAHRSTRSPENGILLRCVAQRQPDSMDRTAVKSIPQLRVHPWRIRVIHLRSKIDGGWPAHGHAVFGIQKIQRASSRCANHEALKRRRSMLLMTI